MSSLTVIIGGRNPSVLVCNFSLQLELTEGEWYVGFSTSNSIPIVVQAKNFEFLVQEEETWKVRFPAGEYEIDDIEAYLKRALVLVASKITLRPNNT